MYVYIYIETMYRVRPRWDTEWLDRLPPMCEVVGSILRRVKSKDYKGDAFHFHTSWCNLICFLRSYALAACKKNMISEGTPTWDCSLS